MHKSQRYFLLTYYFSTSFGIAYFTIELVVSINTYFLEKVFNFFLLGKIKNTFILLEPSLSLQQYTPVVNTIHGIFLILQHTATQHAVHFVLFYQNCLTKCLLIEMCSSCYTFESVTHLFCTSNRTVAALPHCIHYCLTPMQEADSRMDHWCLYLSYTHCMCSCVSALLEISKVFKNRDT